MTRHPQTWTSRALTAAVLAGVLALPSTLEAQRAVPRGGDGGGQTRGQDGGGQDRGNGGGGQDRGGDRPPASPRGGADRRAAPPQTSSPAPQSSAPRSDTAASAPATADSSTEDPNAPSARRRGDNPRTGVAVARRTPRPSGGGTIVVPGGWYPWGWGGYGFAGYYGLYDPWYYGGYGGYGGYGYRSQYYQTRRDDGSVRLKVKPRDASVYVDGYYAGRVDDFDGVFQSLPLEPGPHRIEVQLDGYAPLTFDVRVLPERRVTFEGEMTPAAP